jgi:hypothetical protein
MLLKHSWMFYSRKALIHSEPFLTSGTPMDPGESGAIIALKLWSQTKFPLGCQIVALGRFMDGANLSGLAKTASGLDETCSWNVEAM